MFIPIEEAQTQLAALIERLRPGEEVYLTVDDRPVARLAAMPRPRRTPKLGTLAGTVLSMEHFDDPLEDFKEYME